MSATMKQLLLGALLGTLAACGGAPPAQSPASDRRRSDEEPTTVEEAQAQIARARERLADGARASPPAPMATSPSDPSQPSARSSRPSSQQAPSVGTTPSGPSKSDAPCPEPCRALASMRRAVTALCRITGDDDDRCRDAHQTLSSSTSQVGPCACPR